MLKWIIQSNLENSEPLIKALDNNCIKVDYSFMERINLTLDDNSWYLIYGSIEFCRKMVREGYRLYPGVYGLGDSYNYSNYAYNYPEDVLLNNNYIILPFSEMVRKKETLRKMFGEKYFIKPNNGLKTFTGFVLEYDNFDHEISCLRQITRIEDNTLVVISNYQNIDYEYRFIVINNNVVTGSYYSYDDSKEPNTQIYNICEEFAKSVVKYYQPDEMFTIDICYNNNNPKIIEINSFSHAGFYNSDYQKIIHAVNDFIGNGESF